MGYTDHELAIIRDEHERITVWLAKHIRGCATCYFQGSLNCDLATYAEVELEAWAEVLGYTPNDNEYPSLIRDAEYRDLVADYVTTSSEQAYDRWEGDYATEHYAELDDNWFASSAGRQAVADLSDPRQEAQAARTEADLEHTLWGAIDSGLTLTSLKAAGRIWTTKRGEVGIYKTFISNLDLNAETFHAYCSVCKRGFDFEGNVKYNLLRVMHHAHSHVPDSTLEFFFGDDLSAYVALNGSDATSVPGESKLTDRDYLIRAGRWYIERISATVCPSSQDKALCAAWESYLPQLAR